MSDGVFDGKAARFSFDTLFPRRDLFYAYGLFMMPVGTYDHERLAPLRDGKITFGFSVDPLLRFPAEAVLSLRDYQPDFSKAVPLIAEIKEVLKLLHAHPTVERVREAAVLLTKAAQASYPPRDVESGEIIRFSDHYCPITVLGLPYLIERREEAWMRLEADAPQATGVTLRAYLVGHNLRTIT